MTSILEVQSDPLEANVYPDNEYLGISPFALIEINPEVIIT